MTTTKLIHALVFAAAVGVIAGLLGAVAAQEPLRGDSAVLRGKPSDAKQKGGDIPDEPLPFGAVARLGTARFRHGDSVLSVVFSPDGKQVASGCKDGTVSVWDTATAKELHSLKAHDFCVSDLVFSTDGKFLISRGVENAPPGFGNIRVWDLSEGRELRQFKRAYGGGGPVALSADGKTLVAGSHGTPIFVLDLVTGKERRFESEHVINVAMSADGKILASSGHCSAVQLWDVATGKVLREIEHKQPCHDYCLAIAFSPNGKVLASGSFQSAIRLWDVATGKELPQSKDKRLGFGGKMYYGILHSFTFSPDSQTLAVGGRDGVIHLWDVATGKELRRFEGHNDAVLTVAFSADGKRLASGGKDATVRQWEVATGKEINPSKGHHGPVTSVALSPNGKTLASASWDQSIRLWEMPTGKEAGRLLGHRSKVDSVTWSADGRTVVSADRAGTVRFWDAATGKETRRLSLEGKTAAYYVALSQDSKTLAWGWGTIRLVDVATGRELHQMEEGYCQVFSPDGKTLAAASHEHPLVLWDVTTGKEIRRFVGEGKWENHNGVCAVAFSTDGKTVFGGCRDGTIRVWEVSTGKERRPLRGHQRRIETLAVSADGKYLASGSEDSTIRVWDLVDGKEFARAMFLGHRGAITSVALSPDARYLVSGSNDTTVLVYDVATRLLGKGAPGPGILPKELLAWWKDLAESDARTAHQAMGSMVAHPAESVAFLRERLMPIAKLTPKHLAKLVGDLGDSQFAVRQNATGELEKLGLLAKSALEKARAGELPLETRRRIDRLLATLKDRPMTADEVRTWRAVEVLEQLGVPEARELLEKLGR